MTRLDEIRALVESKFSNDQWKAAYHAREDIPFLLAEIDRLQSLIDSARVCPTCSGSGSMYKRDKADKIIMCEVETCPDCRYGVRMGT